MTSTTHRPFDPHELHKYVMGEAYVNFLEKFFTTLEKDPLFNDGLTWHDYETMDINEHRLLQTKRAKALPEYMFVEQVGMHAVVQLTFDDKTG